jgi:hypothetical protein
MANTRERQTSVKSGVRSTARKLDNSKHGFDQHPASRRPGGAFGNEDKIRAASQHPEGGATKPAKRAALSRMKTRG